MAFGTVMRFLISRARLSHQTRGCSIQSQFATLETRNSKELGPKYVPQVFLRSLRGTRRSEAGQLFANSFVAPSNSPSSLCESEFLWLAPILFDCFLQNRYDEAVACYTECIEIDPENVAVYTNRALCYLRLNQVCHLTSRQRREISVKKWKLVHL